ncbi:hypothetical protein I7I50_08251 [Histoplasma capsulatum G186AR]|uniref:Uncharacterized protein n=1 Tax=Ajellomyces capsulatus TaxID=5037 RepID=A0A8H8CZK0_AJECA|nr:hypothetical protein I7I52_05767 [Histoplasma capsulatum]QSS73468.1 hypothetical protein I7I50_08251 [Histoplasma capsulatum G186AR]
MYSTSREQYLGIPSTALFVSAIYVCRERVSLVGFRWNSPIHMQESIHGNEHGYDFIHCYTSW